MGRNFKTIICEEKFALVTSNHMLFVPISEYILIIFAIIFFFTYLQLVAYRSRTYSYFKLINAVEQSLALKRNYDNKKNSCTIKM